MKTLKSIYQLDLTEMIEKLDEERSAIREFSESIRVSLYYADGQRAPIVIDGASYISIPTDDYVEVAPGVYDRRVENKDDIKFEHEEAFRELLNPIDFEDQYVLFVKFGKASFFDPHYHLTDEGIFCVRGSYESNGKIYRPGEFHYIPAREVHNWNTIMPGLALLTLKKN